MFCTEWLLACSSSIVYERRPDNQVFYVLPVVPVGDTRTIQYCMQQHTEDFVGSPFDTTEGAGDGSRWWYINTWGVVGLELVRRTRREVNKLSLLFRIF